jgi:tyrosyl-DNA phosphodiesterase-1
MAWVLSQYPPHTRNLPLLAVHGDRSLGAQHKLRESVAEFPNVRFFMAPNLDQWGTHHTKMMFLFYETGMRVVAHTANLIRGDWTLKTQGIWVSPLFPRLAPQQACVPGAKALHPAAAGFATDLWDYVMAYGSTPQLGVSMVSVREQLAAHDFSAAGVRIVASVPGTHRGPALHHWGLMKLRRLLEERSHPKPADGKGRDQVICQFSSIGSLSANARTPTGWINGQVLPCVTARKGLGADPVDLRFVFPCVSDVRDSLEGYAAGSCLPHSSKYAKAHNAVLRPDAHKWRADWCGRTHASPHIKTFMRWSPATRLVSWAVLTSHNLSKAAWGQLQLDGSQLAIRSYELGILFLPMKGPSGEPLTQLRLLQDRDSGRGVGPEGGQGSAASADDSGSSGSAVRTQWLAIPYDLPLSPYLKGDDLWYWDQPYMAPDRHGKVWPGVGARED